PDRQRLAEPFVLHGPGAGSRDEQIGAEAPLVERGVGQDSGQPGQRRRREEMDRTGVEMRDRSLTGQGDGLTDGGRERGMYVRVISASRAAIGEDDDRHVAIVERAESEQPIDPPKAPRRFAAAELSGGVPEREEPVTDDAAGV